MKIVLYFSVFVLIWLICGVLAQQDALVERDTAKHPNKERESNLFNSDQANLHDEVLIKSGRTIHQTAWSKEDKETEQSQETVKQSSDNETTAKLNNIWNLDELMKYLQSFVQVLGGTDQPDQGQIPQDVQKDELKVLTSNTKNDTQKSSNLRKMINKIEGSRNTQTNGEKENSLKFRQNYLENYIHTPNTRRSESDISDDNDESDSDNNESNSDSDEFEDSRFEEQEMVDENQQDVEESNTEIRQKITKKYEFVANSQVTERDGYTFLATADSESDLISDIKDTSDEVCTEIIGINSINSSPEIEIDEIKANNAEISPNCHESEQCSEEEFFNNHRDEQETSNKRQNGSKERKNTIQNTTAEKEYYSLTNKEQSDKILILNETQLTDQKDKHNRSEELSPEKNISTNESETKSKNQQENEVSDKNGDGTYPNEYQELKTHFNENSITENQEKVKIKDDDENIINNTSVDDNKKKEEMVITTPMSSQNPNTDGLDENIKNDPRTSKPDHEQQNNSTFHKHKDDEQSKDRMIVTSSSDIVLEPLDDDKYNETEFENHPKKSILHDSKKQDRIQLTYNQDTINNSGKNKIIPKSLEEIQNGEENLENNKEFDAQKNLSENYEESVQTKTSSTSSSNIYSKASNMQNYELSSKNIGDIADETILQSKKDDNAYEYILEGNEFIALDREQLQNLNYELVWNSDNSGKSKIIRKSFEEIQNEEENLENNKEFDTQKSLFENYEESVQTKTNSPSSSNIYSKASNMHDYELSSKNIGDIADETILQSKKDDNAYEYILEGNEFMALDREQLQNLNYELVWNKYNPQNTSQLFTDSITAMTQNANYTDVESKETFDTILEYLYKYSNNAFIMSLKENSSNFTN